MIDIKLIRENRDLVKENIKKKFQEHKLELVDEIYNLDEEFRKSKLEGDNLRALKNKKSSEIGLLMKDDKKEEAEKVKEEISNYSKQIEQLTIKEEQLEKEIKEKMMTIPNIIDDSVPIGENDNFNVEIEKYGEPIVPSYEIPLNFSIISA